MATLEEVLEARKIGRYVDELGQAWRLQRTPAAWTKILRDLATPASGTLEVGKGQKLPLPKKMDQARYVALKVAYAVVEPEIGYSAPEGDEPSLVDIIKAKADTLSKDLTDLELQRLFDASLQVDDISLNLSKPERPTEQQSA